MKEIEARNVIEQAAALFSELNIVEKGIETVTRMEWHGGKVNEGEMLVAADTLDSDDDEKIEIDPLKMIAQGCSKVKLVKVAKPEKTLITEADLEDIESMTNGGSSRNSEAKFDANTTTTTDSDSAIELEPHAINMCKFDQAFDKDAKIKKKFLPFRTTKSDVHSVEHEKQHVKGKHWEVTAATPPILRNNPSKLIPMQESIENERLQKEKLREQIEKHAEGRLAARRKIVAENIALLPPGSELVDPNAFFQSYRQRDENCESENESFSDNSDDGEEQDTYGVTVVLND